MSNNAVAEQNVTLQQINIKLLAHNFPPIPPAKVPEVFQHADRATLIRAVNNLTNPAAQDYVRKALAGADLMVEEEQAEESEGEGRANDDDQAPRHRGEQPQGQERAKFHVYGGRAALCFEEDTTRGGVPTIALDAAASVGPKTYDWKKKVRIQMTRAELPVVAAVLLGKRKSCEFKSHGQDNSKGFSMERQDGGKVFVKVFEKGQGVKAVPIEAPDVFYVASIFLLQIRRSAPWLDATSTIALVGATMQQAS